MKRLQLTSKTTRMIISLSREQLATRQLVILRTRIARRKKLKRKKMMKMTNKR